MPKRDIRTGTKGSRAGWRDMITKLRDFFIGILDEYYSTEHKGLKLFWIFLLASLIGAVVEILFVRVTAGLWMSRSSLLYGQFSVVWGLGATLMTILLHRLNGRDDRYIFICGTILGGAYEYLCSLLGEVLFGVIFWDYSEIVVTLFMIANIVLSAAALVRYGERRKEIPAGNGIERFLDEHYDDAYLEHRYQNMKTPE